MSARHVADRLNCEPDAWPIRKGANGTIRIKMADGIAEFNAAQSKRYEKADSDRADVSSGSGHSRYGVNENTPWCSNCYRHNEDVFAHCQHCGEHGTVTTGEYDAQD